MPNIREIEVYLKDKAYRNILTLIEVRGYQIKIHEEVANVDTEVYGIQGNNPDDYITRDVQGILVGDDFVPSDGFGVGMFQRGYLYTLDNNVNVGHLVDLEREDNRQRKYRVIQKESIGMTIEVFYKYTLSAIEDR